MLIGHYKKNDKYSFTLAYKIFDVEDLVTFSSVKKSKMCHHGIECKGQNLSCGKYSPTVLEMADKNNFNRMFVLAVKFYSAHSLDNLEKIKRKRPQGKRFGFPFLMMRQVGVLSKSISYKIQKECMEFDREKAFPFYSGACKICRNKCTYDILKKRGKEREACFNMCRFKDKRQMAMESVGIDCNYLFNKIFFEDLLWYHKDGKFPIFFSQVVGTLFGNGIEEEFLLSKVKNFMKTESSFERIEEEDLQIKSKYFEIVNKKYFNLNSLQKSI